MIVSQGYGITAVKKMQGFPAEINVGTGVVDGPFMNM